MWSFSKKSSTNIAVIDIGQTSVGGGLVHIPGSGKPVLCATARTPLAKWSSPTPEGSMLAALKETGDRLIREGAPVLRRRAGSGAIDRIIVNIGCPWQKTEVRTERIRPGKTFTFTKEMMSEVLAKPAEESTEFRDPIQTVIATLLNGYAVEQPFGKRAERAELVILSASVRKDIGEYIDGLLRALFHIRTITPIAFAPASYEVLRDLYPLEKDFLMLAVSDDCTDVANVKHGRLMDAGAVSCGTNGLLRAVRKAGESSQAQTEPGVRPNGYIDPAHNARFTAEAQKAEDEWLFSLAGLLSEFAVRNALPRMIFLIADDATRGYLKQALDSPSLRALWLSEEPISIVPVLPQQFTPFLALEEHSESDVPLAILALYAAQHAA